MSHVACWEFDSYVELSLRAKRGICCCLRLERRLRKKQVPHGLRPFVMTTQKSRNRTLFVQHSITPSILSHSIRFPDFDHHPEFGSADLRPRISTLSRFVTPIRSTQRSAPNGAKELSPALYLDYSLFH